MYVEHDRKSIRMPGYDYVGLGAYFVTVCAFERAHIFGNIRDGEMKLNWLGTIVRDEWMKTGVLRTNVRLDEFVVMPNHFHAIVWITDRQRESRSMNVGATRFVGATRASPLQNTSFAPQNTSFAPQNTSFAPQNTSFAPQNASLSRKPNGPKPQSIGSIIGSFKSSVSKRAHAIKPEWDHIWQRNYFDQIIRDDDLLHAIQSYIRDNPLKWASDELA